MTELSFQGIGEPYRENGPTKLERSRKAPEGPLKTSEKMRAVATWRGRLGRRGRVGRKRGESFQRRKQSKSTEEERNYEDENFLLKNSTATFLWLGGICIRIVHGEQQQQKSAGPFSSHFQPAQQTKWASNNLPRYDDHGPPGAVSAIVCHIKLEGKQVAAVWGNCSWMERKHSCSDNTQCTRKATEMPFRVWKCGNVDSSTVPTAQMVPFLLQIPYRRK